MDVSSDTGQCVMQAWFKTVFRNVGNMFVFIRNECKSCRITGTYIFKNVVCSQHFDEKYSYSAVQVSQIASGYDTLLISYEFLWPKKSFVSFLQWILREHVANSNTSLWAYHFLFHMNQERCTSHIPDSDSGISKWKWPSNCYFFFMTFVLFFCGCDILLFLLIDDTLHIWEISSRWMCKPRWLGVCCTW